MSVERVWITGASGQLGRSLQDVFKPMPYHLLLTDMEAKGPVGVLDICDPRLVIDFSKCWLPQVIINCAAYTNVDKAESESDLARDINAMGPGNLAAVAREVGATLIHFSTDFVFDGAANIPYDETDQPNPLSVYGRTKLDGEKQIMAEECDWYILRTSWLYSQYGKNFVRTMIRLGKEQLQVKVVNDQVGSPTFAGDLAYAVNMMVDAINRGEPADFGIYHYSDSGEATWYDLAEASIRLSGGTAEVVPQTFEEYKASKPDAVIAPRPAYSVLDCSKIEAIGIATRSWEHAHAKCMTLINEAAA